MPPLWNFDWNQTRALSVKHRDRQRRRSSLLRSRLSIDHLEDRTLLSSSIPLNANTWTAVGPAGVSGTSGFGGDGGASGRMTGIAVDPTDGGATMYVATAGGGVWKTSNIGATWTPLTDDQSPFMGSIAIAPSNHLVLYAGEGEANNSGDSYYGRGILKTTDGGATWTLTGHDVFDRKTIPRIAISPTDPNTAYAAVSAFGANGLSQGTGIWKTTDGGATWINTTNSISTTAQFSDVVVDPTNDQIVYAALGAADADPANGVYKTTDGGATWTAAGNFPNGAGNGRISMSIAATNPNELVASIADPARGVLLHLEKTTDGGTTWTSLDSCPDFMAAGQGWYDNVVAISSADPNRIIAAGVVDYSNNATNGVVESDDGGTTWTDITVDENGHQPHTDSHAITFLPSGAFVIGNDGGIWLSVGTATVGFQWSNLNGNLQTIQFTGVAADPANPNIIYGGSQDNGTEQFDDNLKWTQIYGGDGGYVAVDPSNPQVVYTERERINLLRSTDGGATFSYIRNGINLNDPSNFYVPYLIDPSNSNHLLYGTNRIYTTTDQGNDWTPITSPNTAGWNSSAVIDAMAIAPSDPNSIYASTDDARIFHSSDGGSTWTEGEPLAGGQYLQYKQFVVDPSDPNTAYVVRANFNYGANIGQVYKTTNGGTTWTNISGDLPDIPTFSIAVDFQGGDRIFVGTDNGVFESNDGGTSWSHYKTGLPDAQVVTLELNSNLKILTAGTHGRGAFQIESGDRLILTPSTLPTIVESEPFSNVELARFTDTAGVMPVGTYSATVRWGDGTSPQSATITDLGNGQFSIKGSHTYALPGTYTLTINASGTDGSTGQLSETVTVEAAPLSVTPVTFTVVEGQTYSGSVGSFSTQDTSALANRFSALIAWGDGNSSAGTIVPLGSGNFEIDGTHQYVDFGTYTVFVTITDSLGGDTSFDSTAHVTAAPIHSTGKTFTAVEGTSNNALVASITTEDVNPTAADFTAVIDWGDGSATTTGTIVDQGGHFDVKGVHDYHRFGTYTIHVAITSSGGATTNATSTANVSDAPLLSTPVTDTISQGDTFNGIVANITDTNTFGLASDLSATINWGDGSTPVTVAGTINTVLANTFTANGSHRYIESGTFTVIVTVTSLGGQTTSTDSTIIVNDAPDTATGTTITGPAGVEFTQPVATFVDAFNQAKLSEFTATIDWGDGSAVDTGTVTQPGGVGTEFVVTGTHGYIYPGNYTITVTIFQLATQVATTTSTAVETDSPVNVTGVPLNPITIDQSFQGEVATFTTVNRLAPTSFYLATIDWGDNSTSTGAVTETSAGHFKVATAAPHAYTAIGTYTITVTILTLSGLQSSATTTLVVNDAPIVGTPVTGLSAYAGTTFTKVIGTFTGNPYADPSNYDVTLDWSDQTTSKGTVTKLADNSFSITGTHAYRFDLNYEVSASIQSLSGTDGSLGEISTFIIVNDVPLNVSADSLLTIQNQPYSGEIATFTTPNLLAMADEYTATVNWGDGTTTQNATVSGASGSYTVSASHTYAKASAGYPLTVIVYHHNARGLLTNPDADITATAIRLKPVTNQVEEGPVNTSSGSVGSVRVLLPISGALYRGSDSGYSNTDGITNINKPIFTGAANPGAAVQIFENPAGSANVGGTLVGQTTADASGVWGMQITTPLADGAYVFNAEMFDDVTGQLVNDAALPVNARNAPLIVDTTAPTVGGVTLNPLTGTLSVAFSDAVGMNPSAVANGANYTFSRIGRTVNQPLAPTGLTLTGGPANLTANIDYSLGGTRGRAGRTTGYVIDINALAITDLAGNTLVEKNFVAFPQLSNSPNPDYIAEIDVQRNVSTTPRQYISLAEQIAAGTYSAYVQSHRVVRVPPRFYQGLFSRASLARHRHR